MFYCCFALHFISIFPEDSLGYVDFEVVFIALTLHFTLACVYFVVVFYTMSYCAM